MSKPLLREIVIAGAARTPTGKFIGSLATTPATSLGSIAIKAAIERAGIVPDEIDYTYLGNMLSAGLGQTPARQAAIGAGIPNSRSAMTVNKACASGLAAVILAAQTIQLGEAETVVAGGMENMSAAPHLLLNSRTGQRLGDTKLIDHMIYDGLWCPFENRHMGGSAEAIARRYELTRAELDEYALRSQRRASAAVAEGAFDAEIVPVSVSGKRTTAVERDETPRGDTSLDKLATLAPTFQAGGSVTAGNSSSLADGAAAVVVMSGEKARSNGVKPLARITAYAHAGNEPGWLFDAPPTAVARLLERAGDRLADFDLIEINEAFAAQVIANSRALGWEMDRVNLWGGAIALGHPIGASGARILVTLLYGLQRIDGKKGLAVICHAGGGAVAMSIERYD